MSCTRLFVRNSENKIVALLFRLKFQRSFNFGEQCVLAVGLINVEWAVCENETKYEPNFT